MTWCDVTWHEGTLLKPGNFFSGLDVRKKKFLYITVCGGTLVEPGELFSGAGFQNNGDLLHNGAWGNLDRAGGTFFRGWI